MDHRGFQKSYCAPEGNENLDWSTKAEKRGPEGVRGETSLADQHATSPMPWAGQVGKLLAASS